jgi:hypothetical protein
VLKGKITKYGKLEIERPGGASREEGGWCLYSETPVKCGDWCPQFGEPYQSPGPAAVDPKSPWYLLICQGRTLVFESLVDERQKGGG